MLMFYILALLIESKTIYLTLRYYNAILAVVILLGIVLYALSIIGLVSSSSIVHASDHANLMGYNSIYGLSYTPAWINITINGMVFSRFSSVFWEPGTLGLYVIFLISIELLLFKKTKYHAARIMIYVFAGLLSLSALFIVLLFLASVIWFINCKNLTFRLILFRLIVAVLVISILLINYNLFYDLFLYRLDYDPSRGFVGNTRSGTWSNFSEQFFNGGFLKLLFGFGADAIFEGDSTSFLIKVFQRGIVGFCFLFLSILFWVRDFKKYRYLLIWSMALAILCQIEGAIFPIVLYMVKYYVDNKEKLT
ncbi:hypothetical protein AB4369_09000 [Vibrio sp. 10N.261.49.A5]|nr:hypothetical protein [Vibrio tasmaniensis]